MKLTVFSLLFAGSMAACPNACSQHGECGEFDSCDCHAGFQGGDCSERVCMYNWAWVTTANGDLNFDGDRYDGTVYSTTTKIEASIADTPTVGYGGQVLLTQAAPGGTWESWPYYGTAEEGHYYMECSNRGLCDRATGDCQCFDGYTGTACNRMVCPEDCSEHGVCQTVKDYDSTYKLWDRNMARSCKCDAGYTGPACQTRECPFGDDPLTKVNEVYETQYVDFFSTCEGSSSADCNTGSTQLGGHGRLTYTDHHGEAYQTAPFAVVSYEGTNTAVAAAAAAALKALPNNVISDTIAVTAGYCEVTVDDALAIDAVGVVTSGPSTPVRILDAGAKDAVTTRVVIDGSNGQVIVTSAGGVAAGTALAGLTAGNYHVSSVANPNCIRLKIDFVGMPGNLNMLASDHSLVTFNGETNAQDGATKARVSSSVSSAQQITGGGTASLAVGYTRPSTVSYEGTTNGQITLPSTITYGTAVLFQGVTTAFHPNSRIKIECKTVTTGVANSWRNLGIYTVSTTTLPTDTVITVQETIVANDCTAASQSIRVTMVSNVITLAAHDLTKTPSVAAGDRVKLTISGVDTTFDTTIKTIEYHSGVTVTNGVKGFIILNEEGSNAAAADVTAATGSLFHHSDGTRENVACSDRGLCQEDGTCKCFPGYTGDSCSIQKSIAT